MANRDDREVVEGAQYQGEDEIITYIVTMTGTDSPSGPVVKVYNIDAPGTYDDVTDVVMPSGSPSFNGTALTLPALKALTENSKYRVEMKFNDLGNTLEHYMIVYGQR